MNIVYACIGVLEVETVYYALLQAIGEAVAIKVVEGVDTVRYETVNQTNLFAYTQAEVVITRFPTIGATISPDNIILAVQLVDFCLVVTKGCVYAQVEVLLLEQLVVDS